MLDALLIAALIVLTLLTLLYGYACELLHRADPTLAPSRT
jgi:hypothetical protein